MGGKMESDWKPAKGWTAQTEAERKRTGKKEAKAVLLLRSRAATPVTPLPKGQMLSTLPCKLHGTTRTLYLSYNQITQALRLSLTASQIVDIKRLPASKYTYKHTSNNRALFLLYFGCRMRKTNRYACCVVTHRRFQRRATLQQCRNGPGDNELSLQSEQWTEMAVVPPAFLLYFWAMLLLPFRILFSTQQVRQVKSTVLAMPKRMQKSKIANWPKFCQHGKYLLLKN